MSGKIVILAIVLSFFYLEELFKDQEIGKGFISC